MDIEITGNETLEELDALMAKYEDAEVVDELPSESSPPEEKPALSADVASSDADTAAESAPANDDTNEQEIDEGTPTGIAAKDGEHVIPYDVLEREREEKAQLKEQLEVLQQKEATWEESGRLLQIRDRQLEKLGVAPEDLPEKLQLTDEQLETLAEDYPDIGMAIRGLVAKVANIERQFTDTAEPASSQPDPDTNTQAVLAAIHANEALNAWHESGGERWDKAIEFDDQLQADPQWANQPLEARFNEAVRLTKTHFDEQITEKAKAAAEKANEDVLPNSPSEVGSSSQHTPSKAEQLLNADAESMQTLMAEMSTEDIENILAQTSD
ncbi:hypothetical protein A1OO_08595 [Enterovibrio norvegicus FF-33]|uniref:hypothetical protein n=1 Tax=Enterovibrio norvegicus TaxID=188144 RepID=UPI0003043D07|nr:hypothetical protein [Enterovibrio norvegicus]OEE65857.1 hypothetical protein A1OO_08595 [Enterovibrio norvegicus FF-33]